MGDLNGFDVETEAPRTEVELGTTFDYEDAMFQDWDSGEVFDYDQETVEQMDKMLERDGQASKLEQVLSLPIRSARWSVEPTDDTKISAWVEETLKLPAAQGGMSTPMQRVIGQITAAFIYRRSYFEKVFTTRDGRMTYDKLAWRPPATCRLLRTPRHGSFAGFKQDISMLQKEPPEAKDGFIIVPPQYAFVYIHNQARAPMKGKSDLRVAHWCYETKQKLRFLWYKFLEANALPKVLVTAQDDGTAQKVAKKLAQMKNNGTMGVGNPNVTAQVIESAGKGAEQFQHALRWLDQEASGSVLAGFGDLAGSAASGTGSFALSSDQSEFFLSSRQSVAEEIAEAITNWVIADLVHYNFGPSAEVPVFRIGPLSAKDMQPAITLLQSLLASTAAQTFVMPTEFIEELIEKLAEYLDLDVDRIVTAVEEAKEQALAVAQTPQEAAVAGIAAPVDAMSNMVAGVTANGTQPAGVA